MALEAKNCSLPKFDAKLLLERLRGRRLMFVGDSLNRNQWESMVCMVQSIIPPGRKSAHWTGYSNYFLAEEYNARLEFYWAPFLVQSNSDHPMVHHVDDRYIMADSIAKHSVHWKGVDYLIFNSYIWWMDTDVSKILRGSLDEGSTVYDEIGRLTAYERVLRLWAKGVEENVDPSRTSVFFMSASPQHYESKNLWEGNNTNCAKETMPVVNNVQLLSKDVDERMFTVANNVTKSTGRVLVTFIDITAMSEFRKDAHTSVNTWKQGKTLTKEQKAHPIVNADCLHWCLPGLPDTWNELLYARIMSS